MLKAAEAEADGVRRTEVRTVVVRIGDVARRVHRLDEVLNGGVARVGSGAAPRVAVRQGQVERRPGARVVSEVYRTSTRLTGAGARSGHHADHEVGIATADHGTTRLDRGRGEVARQRARRARVENLRPDILEQPLCALRPASKGPG